MTASQWKPGAPKWGLSGGQVNPIVEGVNPADVTGPPGSAVVGVNTTGFGTVTEVDTGTGLTGGPVTTKGTISLQTVGTAGTVSNPGTITLNAYGQVTGTTGSGPAGSVTSVSLSAPFGGGTVTSTGTLGTASITAHGVVVGNGTSALTVATIGTKGNVLTDNGAGLDPTFQAPASGSGTVTKVVAGAGLSGGTITTSGTLALDGTFTNHGVLIGTGTDINATAAGAANTFLAGVASADPTFRGITLASADFANQGTTSTVLHGNAAGNPSFGAVSLSADVTDTLGAANGGSGVASPTAHAVLLGEGSSAFGTATIGTAGNVLTDNGAGKDPTFQAPATSGTVTKVILSTPLGGGTVTSSGTLGTTSYTNHGVLLGQSTSALAVTAAGAAGTVLTGNGTGTDPSFQALPVQAANVATAESTSSATYVNLTTTGPSVTLTMQGTVAIVWLSAWISQGGTGNDGVMSVAVSGASTVAAADGNAAVAGTVTGMQNNNVSGVAVITGLTPGLNTFTAKYRVTGGTYIFQTRSIAVFAP